MAAYDLILNLVKCYLVSVGYDEKFVTNLISPRVFSELISVRLADSNVMIKNKINKSSHQTHIAITGEAIDFFYNPIDFHQMTNDQIDKIQCYLLKENITQLRDNCVKPKSPDSLSIEDGFFTIGKRTQKQMQLSKKVSLNSSNFNELRLGLYENDLLILLKERKSNDIFVLGIRKEYYDKIISSYSDKYDANTYLRMAYRREM